MTPSRRRRRGHAPSIALLERGLDRGRRLLRRHAAAGDFRRDIVDDAAHRWTEALVIEVLVVVRLRQIVGDLSHECAFETGLATLDDGNQEVAGAEPRLHVLRYEELEEVGRLLRGPPCDEPAGDAAKGVGWLALTTGHDGKIKPADFIVAETDLVGGEHALLLIDGADGEHHRALAIAEIADRLRVL